MNNKISIGQYVPTNSWLHKIDPRVKIISLTILLVALFLIPINSSWKSLIIASSFLLLSLVISLSALIPFKKIISGIKPLIFLLTFTFIIQLFTISAGKKIFEENIVMNISLLSILGIIIVITFYNLTKKYIYFRTIYFFGAVFLIFYLQALSFLSFGKITSYYFNPTYDGIIRGLFLFIRILTTVLLTSILTFTTMTTDLNFGFESVMKPLKIFKFPVETISMMLALILRFIPTLLFETDKIMKAQASRGLDFKESSIKNKINQVIALLIPIFLISINKAEDLSNAMEVRGYVIGEVRSRIDEHKIEIKDIVVVITSFIILATIIYFKVK